MTIIEVFVATPLRKLVEGGVLMMRPPEIDQAIARVLELPRAELLERAKITDRSHPDFIPSECLLHLLRQSKFDNSDRHFEALFRLLRTRVLRSLPRVEGRSGGQEVEHGAASQIRDDVLGRFQELLCQDRRGYDDRLDFFEVRFDYALKKLRLTARRKVQRQDTRTAPLYDDEEPSLPSKEVEAALARLRTAGEDFSDPGFQKRLNAAIGTLPTDEQRVINMLRDGFPIDSQEPNVVSIASVLGCAEKTVRNRRDRAIVRLRGLLAEGNEP